MFRYLYKGTLAAVTAAASSLAADASLYASLGSLCLEQCAASVNHGRTLQVAAKLLTEAGKLGDSTAAGVLEAAWSREALRLVAQHGERICPLAAAPDLLQVLETAIRTGAGVGSVAPSANLIERVAAAPGCSSILLWAAAQPRASGTSSSSEHVPPSPAASTCCSCTHRDAAKTAVQQMAPPRTDAALHATLQSLTVLRKSLPAKGPCRVVCGPCAATSASLLDSGARLSLQLLRAPAPGPQPSAAHLRAALGCLTAAAALRADVLLASAPGLGQDEVADADLAASLLSAATTRKLIHGEDLAWIAAAFHNIAADLSSARQRERTIVPLRIAWDACRLSLLLPSGDTDQPNKPSPPPTQTPSAADFTRRSLALCDSLRRQGHCQLALQLLASSIAALQSCGAAETALRPLILGYVRTSVGLCESGSDAAPSLIGLLQEQAPSMALTAVADVLLTQAQSMLEELPAAANTAVQLYLQSALDRTFTLLLSEVATPVENPIRRARAQLALSQRHRQSGAFADGIAAAAAALQLLGAALAGSLGEDTDLQLQLQSDVISAAAQYVSLMYASLLQQASEAGAEVEAGKKAAHAAQVTARMASVASEAAEVLLQRSGVHSVPIEQRIADLRGLCSMCEVLAIMDHTAAVETLGRAAAALVLDGEADAILTPGLVWIPDAVASPDLCGPYALFSSVAQREGHSDDAALDALLHAAAQLRDGKGKKNVADPAALRDAARRAEASGATSTSTVPLDLKRVRGPLARAELYRAAALLAANGGRVAEAQADAVESLRHATTAMSRLSGGGGAASAAASADPAASLAALQLSTAADAAAAHATVPGSLRTSRAYFQALVLAGELSERLGSVEDASQVRCPILEYSHELIPCLFRLASPSSPDISPSIDPVTIKNQPMLCSVPPVLPRGG